MRVAFVGRRLAQGVACGDVWCHWDQMPGISEGVGYEVSGGIVNEISGDTEMHWSPFRTANRVAFLPGFGHHPPCCALVVYYSRATLATAISGSAMHRLASESISQPLNAASTPGVQSTHNFQQNREPIDSLRRSCLTRTLASELLYTSVKLGWGAGG